MEQTSIPVKVIYGVVPGDETGTLLVLGDAQFVGQGNPADESTEARHAGMNFLTPKLILPGGEVVYGAEVYWGSAEDAERMIAAHRAAGKPVREISYQEMVAIREREAEKNESRIPEPPFVCSIVIAAGEPAAVESAFQGTIFTVLHRQGPSESELLEGICEAVAAFLATPEGQTADEEVGGDFNWWDLPPYLGDVAPFLPKEIIGVQHLDPHKLIYAVQNTPFRVSSVRQVERVAGDGPAYQL